MDRWDPRWAAFDEQRTAHPRSPTSQRQKNPAPVLTLPLGHYGPETVVELIGFEPTTSALQGRRSPN
jgi:hypothetical protein